MFAEDVVPDFNIGMFAHSSRNEILKFGKQIRKMKLLPLSVLLQAICLNIFERYAEILINRMI